MIVHQSLYGDKTGSYALIKTSLTDTESAKRLCNITDLLDRPSSGYLTRPVFRGFAFNDSFIFIKSFPDSDPSVRKGRVLSHTLIVDQNDLPVLNDLEDLFSHFISVPDKDAETNPITLDDRNSVLFQTPNQTSREAAAINELLNLSNYSNVLVWIGEDGYLSFITQIWAQLTGELRANLKLGVGYNPKNVDPRKQNILYVTEEYESKWRASDYCIISKEALGTLESMSSFLLAGYQEESKHLINLIKNFEIVLTEIEDYRILEIGVNTYNSLSSTTEFNRLIVLCDLLSKYSPNPNVAKTEKNKILTQVLLRIESASPKQILTLKNPDWKGFLNAEQLIGDTIASWIAESLFSFKVYDSVTSVVTAAFDPKNEVLWWKKAVSDALKTTLEKWRSAYAVIVWNWFTEDQNLVKALGSLIPITTQVEMDLVNNWPKSKPELAQHIQVFSKDRKWLILHGLSNLQLYNPEESIKRQLRIDEDPEYFAALSKMGELILDKEFIQLTVKIGEVRLVNISGEKVAKTPSLLSELDVKNVIWRQIWLRAIKHGIKPWDGISKPTTVLSALFGEILKGEKVEPELLLKLSHSDYNDLSGFSRRAEVWQYLSGREKSGFLNATTLGCVKLLGKNKLDITDFEKEIRSQLVDPITVTQIIRDQNIDVSIKIQLFEELPELKENELILLLNSSNFSYGESKRLGIIISRKYWKKAASIIAVKITIRGDLQPALKECVSLLGFFKKLSLSRSGYLSENISVEEWWFALSEQCYDKYPSGPTRFGLWERAGGKNYDLLTKGTGKEIWDDALKKIRNGKVDVDPQKLLKEMSKDYSSSIELNQLRDTYR